VSHEFNGKAAKPESAERATPVGRHHDQIDRLRSDALQDAVLGQAIHESKGHR
jgi:hypothetical protein